VLVPGAGGAAGIGAIKALRLAGYRGRVVATDADPLSPGLELADAGTVLPQAAAPDFFERAMEFIRAEEVEAILPTSGFDTPAYAAHQGTLGAAGVIAVGCDRNAMDTCMDKWRFYERIRGEFPVPRTCQSPPDDLEFPCFVKPRRGKGSRGAAVCRDRRTLEHRLSESDDLLIQEYLPGLEYTVDVLADLDGRPVIAVPRLRLAVKDGISVRGQVIHDEIIDDVSGAARFIEVNPRMGGGTFFTALAGVNMAALCLDLAARRPLPALEFSEITVVRYFEEIILMGEDRRTARRPRRAVASRAGAWPAAPTRRTANT
jgi:carbamoyl-phosphate synthase large subunit